MKAPSGQRKIAQGNALGFQPIATPPSVGTAVSENKELAAESGAGPTSRVEALHPHLQNRRNTPIITTHSAMKIRAVSVTGAR